MGNRGVAIFLCNLTSNMAQPWLDAGYRVVMVDPQHEPGVAVDGLVTRIGATIEGALDALGPIVRSGEVVFVAGFPPCTDVALCGTKHWAAKRDKDRYFQAKAAIVAEQCRMTGALSGAPWIFENPKSAFSKIFGRPTHKFNPWQFTALCAADNYTKDTWLWAGNGFRMPVPCPDPTLGPPDDRIHKCPPAAERGNIRSATPRGFARAVFESNAPHLRGLLVAA